MTIPAGQLTGTVTVNAIGTSEYNVTKTFTLNLSNPTNATLTSNSATGTINNAVAEPTVSIATRRP